MALVSTEIVVARTNRFRDSSLIIKGFSRDYGAISLLAKGARDPKAKVGAALQPFVRSSIVFYLKKSRELHLLAQAELVESFPGVERGLFHLAFSGAGMELLEMVETGEQPEEALFDLLVWYLRALGRSSPEELRVLFLSFALRTCAVSGIRPEVGCCVSCGRVDELESFSPVDGGVLCSGCARGKTGNFRLSPEALEAVRDVLGVKRECLRMGEAKLKSELEKLTFSFLRYHVSGYRELKSFKILRQGQPAPRP